MTIPDLSLLIPALTREPVSLERAGQSRAPASGPERQNFAAQLAKAGQAMELAMLNNLVAQADGNGESDDGGGFGSPGVGLPGMPGLPGGLGGMGLNHMAMSLLATLTAMQEAPAAPAAAPKPATPTPQAAPAAAPGLGELAGRFESGAEGPAAIGYDRTGGTSYGTFQIASKVGTFDRFLDYLRDAAPDMAAALEKAGPANTGSTNGAMPEAWKKLAAEEPERFAALQRDFIGATHYRPVLESFLSQTGLSEGMLPPAVREVLFSTSVQHGASGASGILEQALAGLPTAPGTGVLAYDKLIDSIYDIRSTRFGSSDARVRGAVASRFAAEKELALSLLADSGTDPLSA